MENLENNPAPRPEVNDSNGLKELKEQYESLQHLVGSLVVLVIVLAGAFNLYLWRQVRYSSADLKILRPQVNQMMAEYTRSTAPVFSDFLKKLGDFGRTHPDFAPVLAKYGIKPTNTPGAVPAPSTPVPVPATKK